MKRRTILIIVAMAVVPILSLSARGAAEEEAVSPDVVLDGEGPSWSWDTSPHVVDWYINEGWYNKRWNLETLYDREVTHKTGVEVNINVPAGDGGERLNTMLASRNFPDVLTMGFWEPQFQQLQDSGLLYTLDELIDEYAPTFNDIIPDSMRDWYTFEDGNWYGFVSSFWAPEREERFVAEAERMGVQPPRISSYYGMFARQDIMDEFGIVAEDFEHPDTLIDALHKVKGYRYDGFEVMPIHLGGEGSSIGGGVLNGYFAVPREDADGNLVSTIEHPRYLEQLVWVNRLYREGLIDDRVFTDQTAQVQERFASGNVFLYIGNRVGSGNPEAMQTLYRSDNQAKYVPVGPLRNYDGERPQQESGGVAGWTVTMIPRTANRPDRIIRLLEFLYSDEGQTLHYLGKEGETFEWTDDGPARWIDEFAQFREEQPSQLVDQRFGLHTFFWAQCDIFSGTFVPQERTPAEEMTHQIGVATQPYTYNILPFSELDPPGGTDAAGTAAEIDVFWEARIPEMVMAESEDEVRRQLRENIERVYEIGYGEVHAIRNERFQANKQQLGIEHAWPPLMD